MGLYGERVGAVNFVCAHEDEAAAVMSQAKQRVTRPLTLTLTLTPTLTLIR